MAETPGLRAVKEACELARQLERLAREIYQARPDFPLLPTQAAHLDHQLNRARRFIVTGGICQSCERETSRDGLRDCLDCEKVVCEEHCWTFGKGRCQDCQTAIEVRRAK